MFFNHMTVSALSHEISLKTAGYQFTRGSNLRNFPQRRFFKFQPGRAKRRI